MASLSAQSPSLLVTGGCGFIAANFINYVLKKSTLTKVVNYDRVDLASSDKANVDRHLILEPNQYELIVGDVRNRVQLDRTLRRCNVDTVVHFAALTHVCESYKHPLEFVANNVEATVALLEACRIYGKIKRFVYVSTDEVYGDQANSKPATECAHLQPTNPYSASKASAEYFLNVYHKSYDFPVVTVRMCNAYGPRQASDAAIPTFIQLAIEGKHFPLHGDGLQLRTWLYVEDTCAALYAVLTKGEIGSIYNVGSGVELSVIDTAKAIKTEVDSQLGRKASEFQVVYVEDRPYNDQRYYLDCSKLKAELGWQDTVPFQEGLKKTVTWYLQNQDRRRDTERMLIYGANGWIGGQFVSILEKEGVEYVLGKRRLGDDSDKDVEEELLSTAPTHVASFIGRNHGPGNNTCDYLEGDPTKLAENVRDNLYGPILLAELCRKFSIHLTYIGSGCIFNYDEDHPAGGRPFTEDDAPTFFGSSYSVVKGFTDRLMHHYSNVLNVRIRVPISSDASPRNIITKLASYSKIMSRPNSVTVLPDLLPVLLRLMKKRHTGTLNFVNHGCIENAEIMEAYKKMVDPSVCYELLDENESTELAQKLRSTRCNCHLSTSLLAELAPEVSQARQAVAKAVENYAKS